MNASGDGIDSNGDLTVSGGKTYLSGPVNSGNGILDYNGSAVVTGGIFAASGSSGMAQNFDSSSTQGVMMMNVGEQEEGSELALLDSSGTKLISWTAEKAYCKLSGNQRRRNLHYKSRNNRTKYYHGQSCLWKRFSGKRRSKKWRKWKERQERRRYERWAGRRTGA